MSLEKILSHKFLDEVRLRKYIKKHKIGDPKLWCLLLEKDEIISYESLKSQCLNQYNTLDNNTFHPYLIIDKKILHQIKIDVKRLTLPTNINDSSFYNILLLISHKRHNLGYVQGMADFLVPFLLNYTEFDSYFLYLDLIRKVEFNIINLQGNLILRLREELEIIDSTLYTHFLSLSLDFHIFSFRWFNCLFAREFNYKEYVTVLTFILAHRDINSILLYVGIGILSVFRKEILRGGYNENVLLIQNISSRNSEKEVEKILEIARKLYKKRIKKNV